ncbi:unnamed protein product [Litomosoides sigmodontis]|uniref:Uncharacterized protein n=1 Tax=Litomosoides sigmodontis TaxID=42156 RepID=A0A3P7JM38_LITSI|nr:unnamed protein product [Litomosoides sigmodontis]
MAIVERTSAKREKRKEGKMDECKIDTKTCEETSVATAGTASPKKGEGKMDENKMDIEKLPVVTAKMVSPKMEKDESRKTGEWSGSGSSERSDKTLVTTAGPALLWTMKEDERQNVKEDKTYRGKVRASEEVVTSTSLPTSRSSLKSLSERRDNRNAERTTFLTIYETEEESDYDEGAVKTDVDEPGNQKRKQEDAYGSNDDTYFSIPITEELCSSSNSDTKSVYFTVPSATGNDQTNNTRVH